MIGVPLRIRQRALDHYRTSFGGVRGLNVWNAALRQEMWLDRWSTQRAARIASETPAERHAREAREQDMSR